MQDTKEVVTQVADLLRDFASQLGVTTAQVYEVLTKRAAVEGAIYAAALTASTILLGSIGFGLIYTAFKNPKVDGRYGVQLSDESGTKIGIGCVACFIACVCALFVPGSIIQMLTPEATAVEQLLRVIRR